MRWIHFLPYYIPDLSHYHLHICNGRNRFGHSSKSHAANESSRVGELTASIGTDPNGKTYVAIKVSFVLPSFS